MVSCDAVGRRTFLYSPRVPDGFGKEVLLQACLPPAWHVVLEGRSFGDYGPSITRAFGKLVWQGALFGLRKLAAVIGGTIGTVWLLHFGTWRLTERVVLRWAAFWARSSSSSDCEVEFAVPRVLCIFTLAQAVSFLARCGVALRRIWIT